MTFFRDWYRSTSSNRKRRRPERKARRRGVMELLEPRQLMVNEIVLENQLPGNPKSEWDVVGGGDTNIEGFATDISVDQGGTVQFKINTDATDYRLDIYRMGYYGGMGARKITTVQPSVSLPQVQPDPIRDFETGLADAGNWGVSASWTVPGDAVSGIYFAKLVREDATPGSNHIFFVVRDDNGGSDVLFQTSDSTWQAYNAWGGSSLYTGSPAGRAFAVSYNRPIETRMIQGGMGETNFVFWGEYPMVRWLEMNGYDVSYTTNVDTARRGGEILEHEAFLSVGHDEYWSREMFDAVEGARDAGVDLAFLSGNEIYWKVRWEPSIDGHATDWRTMVCYKESVVGAETIDPETLPPGVQLGNNSPNNIHDPSPIWTGLWRDLRFAEPGDAQVEQTLTGQLFSVNRGPAGTFGTSIQVPEADGKLRFWRNTTVAQLQPGEVATLAAGTLGYEWDEDVDTIYRPAGQIRLSSTTEFVPEKLVDSLSWPGCEGVVGAACSLCRGCMVAPGQATHNMTMYRDPESKAIVFGAGTVQWSWGLDGNHDGLPTVADPRMQQATVNLLADMGAQPGSLQANLVAAAPTTDLAAPTSVITSPAGGFIIQSGSTPVTITGTASDAGGVVGGIEVSVDNGLTWRRADGRGSWTYSWVPSTPGQITIKSRAADDSLNLETPGAGITVTVVSDQSTAPQISDVVPLVINNQTATITWLTDEASDSKVVYGTSAGNLNQSVHLTQMVHSHSVTLSTLTPNTNYFFRVVSNDEFGNESVSPINSNNPHQVSTPAFTDTTLLDFAAGSLQSGASLAQTQDGEVILQPAVQAEFGGSSLPAGWSVTPNGAGGAVTVGSNTASVDGARLGTDTVFGPGRSLDFVATFSGAPFQAIGFATDLNERRWATFSSFNGGSLYARTAGPGGEIDTQIPGNWLGAAHRFRIEWTTSGVAYYIDGVQVASHAVSIPISLRPVASDFNVGGGALVVDWLRMGPHSSSGEYRSRIFDAGGQVVWTRMSWVSQVPAAATLGLAVRMGDTPVPDASWTDYIPVGSSGATIGGQSRYLQYRATLATSDAGLTPALHNVALSYSTTNADAFAPAIVGRSPVPGALNVSPAAPITVAFSELMNANTIGAATIRLRAAGATSDVPATVSYAGSTATLVPLAALAPETSYTVTISGSIADRSGNTLGSESTWNFSTGWLAFSDSGTADFAAGTGAGTSVTSSGDGGLILAPKTGAEFDGPTLPLGWFSQAFSGGGSAQVSGGQLSVDGAMAGTAAFFGPGQTLEFVATFTGDPYQHIGFGVDYSSTPWAIFSTGLGGILKARTGSSHETPLADVTLGVPHRFRIDWTTAGLTYTVDGQQVAAHPGPILSDMRPLVSDAGVGGGAISVDWLRLLPFATSGTYSSRVFDAGSQVAWAQALWNATVPAGTTLAIAVRVGNTPIPDATWTDFAPLAASGAIAGMAARYAQYQAQLTTSAVSDFRQTPTLENIALRYSGQIADVTSPTILSQSPAANAADVDLASAVVVAFRDLIDPATVNASSFRLREIGATQDIPASIAVSGSRITLTPATPLTPNRQFQVTLAGSIADLSGNTIGSSVVWNFTTRWLQFRDQSPADFTQGSLSGTAIGTQGDGQLTLAPQAAADFGGSALPDGWSSFTWTAGGNTTVANGAATVQGTRLSPNAVFQPGSVVEFVATLTGDPYQHIGLGVDLSAAPWALFSTAGGNALFARAAGMSDIPIPGSWFSGPHRFRLEWTAGSIRYLIDDQLVATHDLAIATPMRPIVSDFDSGGGAITVDDIRVLPYVASGTFTSRVFDAGLAVAWDAAAWSANIPNGTTLAVSVRTGQTPTPDSSWTEFVQLGGSGSVIGATARYMQYRVSIATTATDKSPVLDSFSVRYTTDPDTTAPAIVSRSPGVGQSGIDPLTTVDVVFSELLDGTSIGAEAIRLRAAGSSTDVAATVWFTGGKITLQPAVALAGNTTYDVIVSGSIRDLGGTSLGSDVQWTFTTGSGQWLQTSAEDFSLGTNSETVLTSTGGGALQLASQLADDFSGTTLDGDWTVQSWAGQGGGPAETTVAGGQLTMAGSQITSALMPAGAALSARVRFGATAFQHFGLATDFASLAGNHWAMFSTGGTTSNLFARVNADGATQDVNLGALPAGFHDYRIAPTAGGFQFYIDNVLQTTISASFAASTPLRVAMSSFQGSGAGTLQVDSVQIERYAASGEFLSSVFDASRNATWGIASWNATLPAGATLVVETRSGNSATPDATWSDWSAVSSGSQVASPAGRYLQYRVRMTSSGAGDVTPVLTDLLILWV